LIEYDHPARRGHPVEGYECRLGREGEYCWVALLQKERAMLGTVLIVILILALLGALPRWPHSREWGYAPTGGVGLAILVVVILVLLGRI
jgi:hypothetical protein